MVGVRRPHTQTGRRSSEVTQQIDEVTALAKQPSATILGVVHPMLGGEGACIDADQKGAIRHTVELTPKGFGHGRETAIEANHQNRIVATNLLNLE